MRGEEILAGRVLLEMMKQAGDPMRFEPNFYLIEEGYVGSVKVVLLKSRHEHSLRAKPKLTKRHFAVMQSQRTNSNIDGFGVKLRLVLGRHFDSKVSGGLLCGPCHFIKSSQLVSTTSLQSGFRRPARIGEGRGDGLVAGEVA
jgi:hypothetical protein